MPKPTSKDLFTRVPVDLFRMGNASGPRLDAVRPRDVDIVDHRFSDGSTKQMVRSEGGISTFDAVNPRLKGDKWWRIPAGTELPDSIHVVMDRRDPRTKIAHYSLRPARYMPLLEFIEGLRELAEHAQPMFRPQQKDLDDETGTGRQ